MYLALLFFWHGYLLCVIEECEDNLGCVAKIRSILEGSGFAKAEYKDRVAEEGGCA